MIQIGNQTSFSAATPREPFDYAVAGGFDAFEWFPDKKPGAGWDESDLDNSQRRQTRELAAARGMRLSVHARWQANPLSPDSLPLFWKDIELAQQVGAVLLNIHLCHEHGLPAYVDAIAPLIQRTADAGLQLAIENTPHHSPEYFNELFDRLRGLNSVRAEHVGMCLDLGHANLYAATRNDYLQFVDRLAPSVPIIHLHLHENWGDADSHLPLFTGPSARDDSGIRGLLERLRRRNYSGSIILEQWPRPPVLLTQARDGLLVLLQEIAPSPAPAAPASLEISAVPPPSLGAPSQAADDFARQLVAANERCRSWREKLDFVRSLLTSEDTALTTEQLVDVAIYLRFLGTGEIPCAEDGRHFRPAHHARIALQIQKRLARISTPENACILRRIYPWLPSSAPTFQRAEPLTRIRDLAHRNDIPSELKREIKHTLQNKLHRCAGPEDLATSAALLERITATGAGYPPAFVEQFKFFHEELKEFFNARSLDERLNALLPQVGDTAAGLVRRFLTGKNRTTLPEQLAALRSLAELRDALSGELEKNSRDDTQELLLADIGLEDFAFVLLSEMINALDAARPGAGWEQMLEALLLTVRNLALSSVEPEECGALESELRAWQRDFSPADRQQLLRLKATVDRSRRLAEDYSDRIMALFPPRVRTLGRALGVAEHAIRVFGDAEIRGHVVFQFSKLVSALLRRLRKQLALPAWDVLVSGQAAGRLQVAETLDELGHEFSEPTIVLLQNAEGDEEIIRGVTAIVLAHEIPHLSHLGVRARQAGVVFVACEDPASLQELQRHQGKLISLTATPEKVSWEPAVAEQSVAVGERLGKRDARGTTAGGTPAPLTAARLNPERPCIPLEQVVLDNGGAKADSTRRLAELAQRRDAEFRTPPALVVPFGVMEAALKEVPERETEHRQLLSRINEMSTADFALGTERLRDLLQQLRVPEFVAAEVAGKFNLNDRLVVRSSANCEDLEALAGAGLYESVVNVAPPDVAQAVQTVWCSLWTRRAALSRKQAGIPPDQAHIAVLIQQMVRPDFSFVLHTVNPISGNPGEVYAEVAVGLGETLVSAATRGTPYRLVIEKNSGATTLLAFASFSRALRPAPARGVAAETVDYSKVELSRQPEACRKLGRRLAAIAHCVEEAFQQPQDIEGVVANGEIFLVQSRPQQGLAKPCQR